MHVPDLSQLSLRRVAETGVRNASDEWSIADVMSDDMRDMILGLVIDSHDAALVNRTVRSYCAMHKFACDEDMYREFVTKRMGPPIVGRLKSDVELRSAFGITSKEQPTWQTIFTLILRDLAELPQFQHGPFLTMRTPERGRWYEQIDQRRRFDRPIHKALPALVARISAMETPALPLMTTLTIEFSELFDLVPDLGEETVDLSAAADAADAADAAELEAALWEAFDEDDAAEAAGFGSPSGADEPDEPDEMCVVPTRRFLDVLTEKLRNGARRRRRAFVGARE